MNTTRADIGIVGAGPSGARAAELMAAMGARVILLDPKAPWEKPCGGGLTPAIFEEIPELREIQHRARPIHRVRVEHAPGVGFSVPLERPTWMISRQTLSEWQLGRAMAAGAEHVRAKVSSLRRLRVGWRLETSQGSIGVAAVVGADGAASKVRNAVAPRLRVELAPTRVSYPDGTGPTPQTAVLRFYPSVAGYLWDFPRPGHRSVGIGVSNGTWGRSLMDAEVDRYQRSREPCDCGPGVDRRGAVIGTAQLGHGDFHLVSGRDFALLGDAAGFADPLTGEGIRNALRSADLLATAWAGDGTFQRYSDGARRAFEREFQVARFLRRTMFETHVGHRLIEKAMTSNLWYGAVASVADALNEHEEGDLAALLWRWGRYFRAVRRNPETAERLAWFPVPCSCRRQGPEGVRTAGGPVPARA